MKDTEEVIRMLTDALADALDGRAQRPVDFKLISAIRMANEHMRRLDEAATISLS